jgi:hypothetical protein
MRHFDLFLSAAHPLIPSVSYVPFALKS